MQYIHLKQGLSNYGFEFRTLLNGSLIDLIINYKFNNTYEIMENWNKFLLRKYRGSNFLLNKKTQHIIVSNIDYNKKYVITSYICRYKLKLDKNVYDNLKPVQLNYDIQGHLDDCVQNSLSTQNLIDEIGVETICQLEPI